MTIGNFGKGGLDETSRTDGFPGRGAQAARQQQLWSSFAGLPVNHVYVPQDNAVYIHCAQEGQKLDFLRENPKASFTVVGLGQVIEEKFTTRYESAIVQGRASLVEEEAEKVRALELLCGRLAPSMAETQNAYIRASLSKVAVIRLEIREITGKRNRAGG